MTYVLHQSDNSKVFVPTCSCLVTSVGTSWKYERVLEEYEVVNGSADNINKNTNPTNKLG